MSAISKKQAQPPLILALDIGSSATRGRIFDANAATIKKLDHRVRHQMTSATDGTNVCDADEMTHEVIEIVDSLIEKVGKAAVDIGAVAIDTFASTLVGVDGSGKALTPVFTYADSRPAPLVRQLQTSFDEDAVQQRTGCRFHASYLPARLLWLAETQPELLGKVSAWLSLGEYAYRKFLGQTASSFSAAAWTGLLNRHTLSWDDELVTHLPVRADQLSPLHDNNEPLTGMTRAFARRWPQLKQAVWFPSIADGYASNVGSGARDPSFLALAAGTSGAVRVLLPEPPETIPLGLWCYAVNRRQSLLGGALNDAGRAIVWLRDLLKLPKESDLIEVVKAAPRPDTPVVLPFLTGERSPGWAGHATASFTGMDQHTTAAGLFRAAVEGIGQRMELITEQIQTVAPHGERIVASGGAVDGLPDWLQILADIMQLPVAMSLEPQSTLRGTAEIALDTLVPDRQRPVAPLGRTFQPNPEHATFYRAARQRQQDDYRCLVAEREPAATDKGRKPAPGSEAGTLA